MNQLSENVGTQLYKDPSRGWITVTIVGWLIALLMANTHLSDEAARVRLWSRGQLIKLAMLGIQVIFVRFAFSCVLMGTMLCALRGCWFAWTKRKINKEYDVRFAELTASSRAFHEPLAAALAHSRHEVQELVSIQMETTDRLQRLHRFTCSLRDATQYGDLALRSLDAVVAHNERYHAAREENGVK